jgi:hypothetical protein
MSPSEINFDSFSGGSSSPLSGSDTAEKLTASKDSGLRPLLSYFENLFSDHIVGEFSDNFLFRWTGLDPEDADKKHEKKKLILTVDEMRAEEGYAPMKDKILGGAPLNPAMGGMYQQLAMPQPDPAAGGAPGGDGDAPGDDQDGAGQPGAGDDADQQNTSQNPPDFGENSGPDFGAEPDIAKAFNLPVYTLKDLLQ